MRRSILYYTCNTHRPEIDEACRRQLLKAGLPIVSVSLNKSIDFGDVRIVMDGKRSPETMHRQIWRGLQDVESEYVFFCESDVLYHPSHFEFIQGTPDRFWYNEHTYKVDYFTGKAVFYYTKQVSHLCAYTPLLFAHYANRMEVIERDGFHIRQMSFEPGCRGDDAGKAERWMSQYPNLDIRHDRNITKSKWSLDDFRDKRTSEGWKEVEEVPYWGATKDRMAQVLADIME